MGIKNWSSTCTFLNLRHNSAQIEDAATIMYLLCKIKIFLFCFLKETTQLKKRNATESRKWSSILEWWLLMPYLKKNMKMNEEKNIHPHDADTHKYTRFSLCSEVISATSHHNISNLFIQWKLLHTLLRNSHQCCCSNITEEKYCTPVIQRDDQASLSMFQS